MNALVKPPRSAIRLPANPMGRPIFNMAGETADISALAKAFDGHATAVQAALSANTTKLEAIETEIDKINERTAAMTVGSSGAGRDTSEGDLRSEQRAIATYFRTGARSPNGTGDASGMLAIHQAHSERMGIKNNMSVGSDPDGGYFVLPAFATTMIKKLFDVAAMRRLSRVEMITAGDEWQEPIDFGDTTSGWVGESQPRSATPSPQIGKLIVPVNEAYSQPPVTQRLLDDVGFDLGGWLTGKVVSRFGRDEGLAFLAGTGVNQPRGLLTYPITTDPDNIRPWGTIQYVPTGASGAFKTGDTPPDAADCLKQLIWTLRTPYRAGASFLMNSNTMSQLDRLKNSLGDYLLRPSMTAGAPNSLLGYPIEIDDIAMPDIGASTCSVAFGNFKLAYLIVDKIGIRLIVDPFTAKPLVNFYYYRRVGGGLQNSEAVKLLRFSVS